MKNFLYFAIMLFSASVFASDCPHLYPNPQKPIVSLNSVELCNSFYVVHYSPTLKGVLFSSAVISINGEDIRRVGSFKSDKRLAPNVRAEDYDYTNSGYDRGHMTAAGDADTVQEMADTFLLSNAVPQSPILNRGLWKELEARTRNNLQRNTVVVTGAIYRQWDLRTPYQTKYIGKNQIPVPYAVFKIVYNDVPVIWYAENKDDAIIKEISFIRLKTLTGINFK